METYHFHLSGNWQGGRNGTGALRTEALDVQVSIPKDMNGPGIGTNPDELLLAAAANCYMITLAAILENRHIRSVSLQVDSEATVELDGGRLTYKSIVHRPHIVLSAAEHEEQQNKAEQAAYRAEKACMITRALQGNVEITVEPRVERESSG